MNFVSVEGATVSDAWCRATKALWDLPKRKAVHTVVRIADPVAVVDSAWLRLDELLSQRGEHSITTVANTIFPAELARTSSDHDHLVARYRRLYPDLKRALPANRRGTYFGRLVAYPPDARPVDQLGAVIARLSAERVLAGPKSARYEAAIAHPADVTADDLDGVQDVGGQLDDCTAAAGIYQPGVDNNPMSFPCLSHCSFQLDGRSVHLLAHYRSQYMVARGYGNYVGLGRLLTYVADRAGLSTGHLTVVAGLAQVDGSSRRLKELVSGQQVLIGPGS